MAYLIATHNRPSVGDFGELKPPKRGYAPHLVVSARPDTVTLIWRNPDEADEGLAEAIGAAVADALDPEQEASIDGGGEPHPVEVGK